MRGRAVRHGDAEMTVRVEHSIEIERAPRDVFDYLTDLGSIAAWQSSVVEARCDTPLAAGVAWREVRRFMGRTVEGAMVVTEFEPHRRFAAASADRQLPVRFGWDLEPTPAGTRVTFSAEAAGSFGLAGPLLTRTAKKQVQADLATAKRLLEARP
ncbi:hypothetical protein BH18CHL2_BH18CHL2_13130 [soil metagenome]